MTSPSAASEPRPALPRRPSSRSRRPSFLSRRTLLRRACLVAGTVPLAAAIDGVAITPRRLVTSTHSFGQAASTDRLRIVQVSDLHVHGIGTLERQLLEQLHESQADLKVFKVPYESQAKGNEGRWFWVSYASQADQKIFFVDYASQADLKIFFVKYESQAGWRTAAKKHLLY